MNIRHLATKVYGKTIELDKSVVYNNLPIAIPIHRGLGSTEEVIFFNKRDRIELSPQLNEGHNRFKSSPISDIFFDENDEVISLCQLFDFNVKKGGILGDVLPEGASFSHILNSSDVRNFMVDTAVAMFGGINPLTGEPDIVPEDTCAEYVPLAVLTGAMQPQMDEDGNVLFNKNGSVSISDFLDSLSCLSGGGLYQDTGKSLDLVTKGEDYFHDGYVSCLGGYSSPFYNLYTREELFEPVTRIELAYLIVICWDRFIDKFNGAYSNSYNLGINFDWENPLNVIHRFEDGLDYRISKITLSDEILSLNIQDYRANKSMTAYKEDLYTGVKPIPVPMFMSMLELAVLGVFPYPDSRLDPLLEVTRGELSEVLVRLAELLPVRYI